MPRGFDYQAEADGRRDAVLPLLEAYEGPGVVETYTVPYDGSSAARFGMVVARTPAGERFLARVAAADEASIAFLTNGAQEPVGSAGFADRADDGEWFWRRA